MDFRTFEPFSIDFAGSVSPFWVYKRIPISHYREIFNYEIEKGFEYFLRSVSIKYPTLIPDSGNDISDFVPLEIEFFDNGTKARQLTPYPAQNLSSLAGQCVRMESAPAPVIVAGKYGQEFNLTALETIKDIILNFPYQAGDSIRIDVTGTVEYLPGVFHPLFVDILLKGYRIPDKKVVY